ncbi:MAG: amino acid ABC transporter permease [Rhodocyclaceae bacterium]
MLSALDFSIIPASLPFLWAGFLFSLKITVTAMVGGTILGTLLAMARLSGGPWLATAATVYINTMRSIPLLMVIMGFFIIIPTLIGHPIGSENSALITFTVFQAAYYGEIMRAGIQSVSTGQVNASYALGMTYWQAMGHIILPQAVRNMLPLLLTQTIVLFQDTSLVYAIGAKDLFRVATNIANTEHAPVEMYLFVALIYFVICFSLSLLVKHMQKRIAIVR